MVVSVHYRGFIFTARNLRNGTGYTIYSYASLINCLGVESLNWVPLPLFAATEVGMYASVMALQFRYDVKDISQYVWFSWDLNGLKKVGRLTFSLLWTRLRHCILFTYKPVKRMVY